MVMKKRKISPICKMTSLILPERHTHITTYKYLQLCTSLEASARLYQYTIQFPGQKVWSALFCRVVKFNIFSMNVKRFVFLSVAFLFILYINYTL